jgi:hypothetical protein
MCPFKSDVINNACLPNHLLFWNSLIFNDSHSNTKTEQERLSERLSDLQSKTQLKNGKVQLGRREKTKGKEEEEETVETHQQH